MADAYIKTDVKFDFTFISIPFNIPIFPAVDFNIDFWI